MDEQAHYSDGSFQTIKQGLDPAFSYIVFERTVVRGADASFDDVFDTLSALQKPDTVWRIYTDKIERILWLVIQMVPEHAEDIMNEVLETALKKDLKYYYYRNRR